MTSTVRSRKASATIRSRSARAVVAAAPSHTSIRSDIAPNLRIATHSLVARVIVERGRAIGVEYRRRGVLEIARCDGEVLLSAGSINSPQLLMLSGIGPASHLEAFGIPVVAPLPGVGANLQDHLDVCTLYQSRQPITYDFTLFAEARVALRYWLTRRGPGVSNVAEAGGFLCSRHASEGRPDIQLHFVPAQLDDHGRNRLPGHGFTLHACFLRPRSRGCIRLRSPRADEAPLSVPTICRSAPIST